jgi:hypothetical protein
MIILFLLLKNLLTNEWTVDAFSESAEINRLEIENERVDGVSSIRVKQGVFLIFY